MITSMVTMMLYSVLGLLVLGTCFFAVLFLQSGFDKVRNREENLGWMIPHFEKSPFRDRVPGLLTLITVLEMAAGWLNVLSILITLVALVSSYFASWMAWVLILSAILNLKVLLILFAGQRFAKDYTGAAGIVPYFGLALFHGLMVVMGANYMVTFFQMRSFSLF